MLNGLLRNISEGLRFPGGNAFRFCYIRCGTCECQHNELRCPLSEDERLAAWADDQLRALDKNPAEWALSTATWWPSMVANLILFRGTYALALENEGSAPWGYWKGRLDLALDQWRHGNGFNWLESFAKKHADSQDPELIEAVGECQAILALTDSTAYKDCQHND